MRNRWTSERPNLAAYRLGRQPMVPDLAGETGLEALESTQQEGPYRHRCVGRLPWPCRSRRHRRSLNAAGPTAWTIRRDVSGGTRPCKGMPPLRWPHSEALRGAVKSASPGARGCRQRVLARVDAGSLTPWGHWGQIGGQRAQAPADSARLAQSVCAGDDEKPPVRLRPGQGISAEIASGRRGRRFKSGHPDHKIPPMVTGYLATWGSRLAYSGVRFWELNGSRSTRSSRSRGSWRSLARGSGPAVVPRCR